MLHGERNGKTVPVAQLLKQCQAGINQLSCPFVLALRLHHLPVAHQRPCVAFAVA